MGVNASEQLTLATGLGHIGIISDHADRIFRVPCITAGRDITNQFLVDIAKDVTPINPVVRKPSAFP
ncbi:MAG: hypothetical protein MJY67_02515 [Bacteroidales bacterium]|nr:hypothetical protein [Bacteroidales bacterium]